MYDLCLCATVEGTRGILFRLWLEMKNKKYMYTNKCVMFFFIIYRTTISNCLCRGIFQIICSMPGVFSYTCLMVFLRNHIWHFYRDHKRQPYMEDLNHLSSTSKPWITSWLDGRCDIIWYQTEEYYMKHGGLCYIPWLQAKVNSRPLPWWHSSIYPT